MPAWIFATWALGHRGPCARAIPRAHTKRSRVHSSSTTGEKRSASRAPCPSCPTQQRPSSRRVAWTKPRSCSAEYGAAAELLDASPGSRRHTSRAGSPRGGARRPRGSGSCARRCRCAVLGRRHAPFERARSLLALGATQRRMKRRREARETLDEALDVFERIGAALWAERARGELKPDQRASRDAGRADTGRGARRGSRRRGQDESRGRCGAVRLRPHRRRAPLAHLRQARHPSSHGDRRRSRGSSNTGVDAPNTGDSPVSAELVAP